MPDALNPGGQHMQQKAAHEFRSRQLDDAFAAVGIGAHPQADVRVVDAHDALVGEGGAVGVARQIVEHLCRSTQRRLRVHHPRVFIQLPAALPPLRVGSRRVARQCLLLMRLLQGGHELAAK